MQHCERFKHTGIWNSHVLRFSTAITGWNYGRYCCISSQGSDYKCYRIRGEWVCLKLYLCNAGVLKSGFFDHFAIAYFLLHDILNSRLPSVLKVIIAMYFSTKPSHYPPLLPGIQGISLSSTHIWLSLRSLVIHMKITAFLTVQELIWPFYCGIPQKMAILVY